MGEQLELATNFFVGYYTAAGGYVSSLARIRGHYLGSPMLFWLDAVTSIPVSFFELAATQAASCTHTRKHTQVPTINHMHAQHMHAHWHNTRKPASKHVRVHTRTHAQACPRRLLLPASLPDTHSIHGCLTRPPSSCPCGSVSVLCLDTPWALGAYTTLPFFSDAPRSAL